MPVMLWDIDGILYPMTDQDDQLPDDEIASRMERNIRRFLKTPPQPRGKNPAAAAERKKRPSVAKAKPKRSA